MIQTRSIVLFQLASVMSLPGSDTTVYKRLKRFVQFTFPELFVARLVLAHVRDQQVLLLIDRTNWKWGQQDINILLLSVRWRSFSFPLVWSFLPHGGASDTATRVVLLERLRPLLNGRYVILAADREFVGKAWFTAIRQFGWSPVIRLRADSRVGHMPVWALFKKMTKGEVRVWHRPLSVYGQQLRVLACKQSADGETLFLAYQGRAEHALKRYAFRWNAECLHQALKSRGFNLEATHLTHPERMSTLLTVVSLAFIWCCLVGEFEEQRDQSRCLKHGYAPKSLFRRGLDALRAVIFKPECRLRDDWPAYLSAFVP